SSSPSACGCSAFPQAPRRRSETHGGPPTMAKVPAPTKLGAKARRLWNETTEQWELRPDELRVLEDACRQVDLIERIEKALADQDLIVRGSQGQPVANPLVQEVRQHRA